MIVRLLDVGDAGVLADVADDVFDHPVRPDLAEAFLRQPQNLIAVAIDGTRVVGMATGLTYLHPDKPLQLFVNEVGVSAAWQRQGLGRRLVTLLLERARELGCVEAWVATEVDNTPARALYAALQGVEDPEHAVVYTYDLSPNDGT